MRLIVSNLAPAVNKDILIELFEESGTVKNVKVFRGIDGRHSGLAFVDMATEAQAQQAMNELNKEELQGNIIEVKISHDWVRSRSGQVTQVPDKEPAFSMQNDVDDDLDGDDEDEYTDDSQEQEFAV